jgi:hypothetical protein
VISFLFARYSTLYSLPRKCHSISIMQATWLSLPIICSRVDSWTLPLGRMDEMSSFHAVYVWSRSEIWSDLMSSHQPSTVLVSDGVLRSGIS